MRRVVNGYADAEIIGEHHPRFYLEQDIDGEFLGRRRHQPLDAEHDNYRNGYRPRKMNFFGLGELELLIKSPSPLVDRSPAN